MSEPSRARVTYLALQRKARSEGRPSQELFELYVLEGVLARLAASPHRDKFVLKGGVLLAVFGNRRPTRDVDLAALTVANDAHTVGGLLRDVLSVSVGDGLAFDVGSLQTDVIRDEDEYSGVRVSAGAQLHTARLTFHIDVNVGDPIHPSPNRISVPSLIDGREPIVLWGYPIHMVFAEKLVTAMQRGIASTRWRDYGDIWTLSRCHDISGTDLEAAVRVVVSARRVTVTSLSDVLDGYAQLAQSKWRAWRRRQDLTGLPEQFSEVVADVIAFGDPVFVGSVNGRSWSSAERRWR